MKTLNLVLSLMAIVFLTFSATNLNAQITGGGGRLLTVNNTGDTNDANVGDGVCLDSNGKCTLRAAVQESNALGFNVINFALPHPSVIELTLGELLITKPVDIIGTGARNLTIQRNLIIATPPFRIFHIAPQVGLRFIMRGFTVSHGSSETTGGGFYIEQGNTVFMTDVAFNNNRANQGGAIANFGTLNLTRVLLNSNTSFTSGNSNGAGAGLYNAAGSAAMVVNSTLTENSGVVGGAVYNSGNLLLINNTLTQNVAALFGASVLNAGSGTVNVLNTIIGMDTTSPVSSLWGAFTSLGNNLITDGRNTTGFTNGVGGDQVSDNNAINPLLGNLADNGGPTDTRALLEGSPAIDHGNNCVKDGNCIAPVPTGFRITTDQRVFSRLGSTVDVGAYEIANIFTNGTFAFGAVSFRPRLAGSLAILTNARTNEKRYSSVSSFGNFRFNSVPFGDIYILERKSKRNGLSSVIVLEFDISPIPFPVPGILPEDLKFLPEK